MKLCQVIWLTQMVMRTTDQRVFVLERAGGTLFATQHRRSTAMYETAKLMSAITGTTETRQKPARTRSHGRVFPRSSIGEEQASQCARTTSSTTPLKTNNSESRLRSALSRGRSHDNSVRPSSTCRSGPTAFLWPRCGPRSSPKTLHTRSRFPLEAHLQPSASSVSTRKRHNEFLTWLSSLWYVHSALTN